MQAASAFRGARAAVWLLRPHVAACFPAADGTARALARGGTLRSAFPAFQTLSSQRTSESPRPLTPPPLRQCHGHERDTYVFRRCQKKSLQMRAVEAKCPRQQDTSRPRRRGSEADRGARHSRTRAQRNDTAAERDKAARFTKPAEKSSGHSKGGATVCV